MESDCKEDSLGKKGGHLIKSGQYYDYAVHNFFMYVNKLSRPTRSVTQE
jgi:hypothetical protein